MKKYEQNLKERGMQITVQAALQDLQSAQRFTLNQKFNHLATVFLVVLRFLKARHCVLLTIYSIFP
jgi:hypothetical protein